MKDKDNEISSSWIPVRAIIHEDVLQDPMMVKRSGPWLILDFALPEKSSNTFIIGSSLNPPDEEDLKKAEVICWEFIESEKEIEEIGIDGMVKTSKIKSYLDEDIN